MLKNWLKAFRLRTLPLSFSCILVGNFLAYGNNFRWSILWLSLATTLFLQILSNLANDLGDAQKGTDNHERVGPARAIQSGKISMAKMKKAVVIFSILSFFSGSLLLFTAFGTEAAIQLLIFFLLGFGAIGAAIFYTVGKKPYGYRALGDVFVLIFFGWVGVLGSYYLQAQTFFTLLVFPATSIGLLAVGVLNMNNIRDFSSDKNAGKVTLPIVLGLQAAKRYHIVVLVNSLVLFGIFLFLEYPKPYLAVLLIFLVLIPNIKKLLSYTDSAELDPELKRIALTTFAIALTFSVFSILFKH